ncbi:MAG: tRNA pseudouridine(55) synthase TruB [Bacteroidota bacterium]|jgi:tRNA pseudouridine55 synthase
MSASIQKPTLDEVLEGSVLLVDKPLNWTSFDVVGKLKWILRNEGRFPKFKIGHAGTLDPLATGLLVVCTGKMTKSISQWQDGEKEYTGTMELGFTTPSFDRETLPVAKEGTFEYQLDQLQALASSFIGMQEQRAPVYSAKQIDGKRAYEFARNEEQVEIKMHGIEVFEFELSELIGNRVNFKIRCSKGTYIRSLAHDFGERGGFGAYLWSLRRTQSLPFRVEDALTPKAWVEHFFPTYSSVNEHFSDDSVKKVFTKAF